MAGRPSLLREERRRNQPHPALRLDDFLRSQTRILHRRIQRGSSLRVCISASYQGSRGPSRGDQERVVARSRACAVMGSSFRLGALGTPDAPASGCVVSGEGRLKVEGRLTPLISGRGHGGLGARPLLGCGGLGARSGRPDTERLGAVLAGVSRARTVTKRGVTGPDGPCPQTGAAVQGP